MKPDKPVMKATPLTAVAPGWPTWAILTGVLGVVAWSLWPGLAKMVDRWETDSRYSHGYLVPLFAVALLYVRRPVLMGKPLSPSWWGLALVLLGSATQLAGGYLRVDWLDGMALPPYLAGVSMLVLGWTGLRWAWPSIAYLGFMVPLPYRIEVALGGPLQKIATLASTYVLQTLGLMAFSEGNVIQLNEARIGVVDACNGLSMLMTFVALATAAAMVVKRPWLDRAVLVLSAIPVALIANVTRIVVTGILYEKSTSEWAEHFYHDLAGWVMIPYALVLYWAVLKVWSWLFITMEEGHAEPVALGIPGLAASRVAPDGKKSSSEKAVSSSRSRRG